MTTTEIVNRVRAQRDKKGFSQEYMANKLQMAQSNYAKLERGETKLSVERLLEIAKTLEIDVLELLPSRSSHVFQIHDNPNSANGYIEQYHAGTKDLYEKLLAEKDRVIALLEAQLVKNSKE